MKVTAILVLFLLVSLPAQATESERRTLSLGGQSRSYELYRPTGLARNTTPPLVVVLHGGFGSGAQAERAYNWDDEATRQGFIVAYPNGIKRSWNAGGTCCGPAQKQQIDDVVFLTQVIETILRDENIDTSRVYLAGMSNGAAMSYRYACEGSFPIAAIGTVAGSLSAPCLHPRPVSVMEIHGLADEHVPMQGGIGSKSRVDVAWLPVAQSIASFRQGCEAPITQSQGVLTSEISACPQGREVALITIKGAGHQWPGGKGKNPLIESLLHTDPPSTALDATSTLWAFFQKHPRF